jgi:hypothetical protein
MFWKTYQFEAEENMVEIELQKFAEKHGYRLLNKGQQKEYTLQKNNIPGLVNLFDINISSLSPGHGNIISLYFKPKSWLLVAYLLLVFFVGYHLFDFTDSRSLSLNKILLRGAFPMLFAIPFMYHFHLSQVYLKLKGILIPNFLNTTEGRKEQFLVSLKASKMFTNVSDYFYLVVIGLFLTGLILWMLDLFNPQDLLNYFIRR